MQWVEGEPKGPGVYWACYPRPGQVEVEVEVVEVFVGYGPDGEERLEVEGPGWAYADTLPQRGTGFPMSHHAAIARPEPPVTPPAPAPG